MKFYTLCPPQQVEHLLLSKQRCEQSTVHKETFSSICLVLSLGSVHNPPLATGNEFGLSFPFLQVEIYVHQLKVVDLFDLCHHTGSLDLISVMALQNGLSVLPKGEEELFSST